jgi:hypothetical protein
MAGEAINVRGPCSNCGAQLATDQRYCIECGQRVGPPMALPYALPAPLAEPPGAAGWAFALPIPLQMASTFAAIALGFGVVVGTAISPNLTGIVAAPSPTVVAQAPPEVPSTPPSGGGGSGNGSPAAAGPVATVASTTSSGGGGGGGNGGGKAKKKKKKKKEKEPAPLTFTGTVVRVNPVAQSYTISTGGLIAIHADTLPQVGDTLAVPVRKLANSTYAEDGGRSQIGTADSVNFSGTVTYCADLEHPAAACDGGSPADHYVYSVSGLGASVLVSAPHPAQGAPPQVGSAVQVGVHIGAAFQPIPPSSPTDWAKDPACTPPYNEQTGLPSPSPIAPELTQTSVSLTSQGTSALLESVVQTVCPVGSPKLVLSADDLRESGRDLAELDVPAGIDLTKLNPGEAVKLAVDVATDGALTLRGIASDQGAAGADDATQAQGTLAGG